MKMGKGKKIMGILLYVVLGAVVLIVGNLVVKNQKPQMSLGMEGNQFKEIPNKDNAVSTQTAIKGKQIEPLKMKETLESSKDAMKHAFETYGDIAVYKEEENYIYAVATTGKMKFHDDIEVYFDTEQGHVHYKSASRAGYSDMGLNRQRFEALAATYNAYQ